MASTIQPQDLTVTITESYEVNGVTYGNTSKKTFTTQGEILQRVMSVDTTITEVVNFGTVDKAGQVVTEDYAYFRITNLDDTNFVRLEVDTIAKTYNIKLKAGDSFLLMDNEMDAQTELYVFDGFADIAKIRAISDTADCDIEVITVTR